MADDATNEAVVTTRQLVNEYLAGAFDEVEVADGVWTIRYGSAKVDITVDVFDEDSSVVRVVSPAVTGCAPSPELYKFIATDAPKHAFGHLEAIEQGDTITITFGHSLLGDFLDLDFVFVFLAGRAQPRRGRDGGDHEVAGDGRPGTLGQLDVRDGDRIT